MGKYGRTRQATDDSIVWFMHIACCIHKAIVTHPEYVILLTTFPWQQCYREHGSLLHSYIYSLFCHSPVYALARARAHTHTQNMVWTTLNLSAVGFMGWWWTYKVCPKSNENDFFVRHRRARKGKWESRQVEPRYTVWLSSVESVPL